MPIDRRRRPIDAATVANWTKSGLTGFSEGQRKAYVFCAKAVFMYAHGRTFANITDQASARVWDTTLCLHMPGR
jgi:hypothetical protein